MSIIAGIFIEQVEFGVALIVALIFFGLTGVVSNLFDDDSDLVQSEIGPTHAYVERTIEKAKRQAISSVQQTNSSPRAPNVSHLQEKKNDARILIDPVPAFTERKDTESALEESEEKFHQIANKNLLLQMLLMIR